MAQARFWMLATGLPAHDDDVAIVAGDRELAEGESICLTDGGLRLWLTRPDVAPPLAGRMHIDVSGDRDLVAQLLERGATQLRDYDHGVVLTDPEGNPFCIELVD